MPPRAAAQEGMRIPLATPWLATIGGAFPRLDQRGRGYLEGSGFFIGRKGGCALPQVERPPGVAAGEARITSLHTSGTRRHPASPKPRSGVHNPRSGAFPAPDSSLWTPPAQPGSARPGVLPGRRRRKPRFGVHNPRSGAFLVPDSTLWTPGAPGLCHR